MGSARGRRAEVLWQVDAMLIVVLTCLAIMAITTVIHYKALPFLSMERFWSLRKGLDRA